jgi:hypothetical protein|nr:MAG TPA: hypothetical protein [Caudoviricetes sp.]
METMKIEARYVGEIKEKKIDSINLRSRQSKSKPSRVYHNNHQEIKTVCRCKNVILAAVLFYLMYYTGFITTKGVADTVAAVLDFEIAFCLFMEWLDRKIVKFLR